MSSLYGLFGERLGHSLSPAIHSLIFKELKIDAYYHLFEVKQDELPDAIRGLKVLGVFTFLADGEVSRKTLCE